MKLTWEHKDGTPDVVAVVAGMESRLLAKAAMALLPITCTTCGKRPAVGIVAVPYMATSEPICGTCCEGDAIPWDLCVANTACIGSRTSSPETWQRIIEDTCFLNNKTLADFDLQVAQGVAEMAAAMDDFNKRENE